LRLRISKEFKAGVIALLAIVLLIIGINFLKGNSIFGDDREFYAYFPNSGQLAVSSNVTLNGVTVGKVKEIEYVPGNPDDEKVKITFSITNSDIEIPKGSIIEIGNIDLLTKGLIILIPEDISKGNYENGSSLQGRISQDVVSQVKAFTDPITQKLQTLMVNVDGMVSSLSSFWDEKATSQIERSLREVKITIEKLGNVADELQSFVAEEKLHFSRILNNVEDITNNLKKSNDQVTAIVGNVKAFTDTILTVDYKGVILDARNTLQKLDMVLDEIENGNGSMGKLLRDEKLYLELVETNNELQNMISDFRLHPERYINFSIFGAKTKGVPISKQEEKKLRLLLDSIPE
jgi:phospholipid/cholesterol/gamma-HCH transport system substrate-binding protein